jgi:hypothetical protein
LRPQQGKNVPNAVQFSYPDASYCSVLVGLDYDNLDTWQDL